MSVSLSAPMTHPALASTFVLTLVTFSLLGGPAGAAKVTCPNSRYVLLSGADLIATTPGNPPTIEVADGAVSVLDGCPVLGGRAKPTKKGVRVKGKFKDCGERPKLKLKALIDPACSNVAGTIRGRGVTPVAVTGTLSLCGNGVVDASTGEECDTGVACAAIGDTCSQSCRCVGSGGGGVTTTTIQGGNVTVEVVDAFCTTTGCSCGMLPGLDYHLQASGTASGPVGTELRVNVNANQGGQLDCGGWSPIDTSVNAACGPIKCCKRESGQPETANWAATEALDFPCFCPSSPIPLLHNYLGQAQLPPAGAPVESEKTTSPCP